VIFDESPRLIGQPVFAGFVADDEHDFFSEEALTEADAIDSAIDVEVTRDNQGVYRLAVPVSDYTTDPAALRMDLGEAVELVRAMLQEGGTVTLRSELTDADVLHGAV